MRIRNLMDVIVSVLTLGTAMAAPGMAVAAHAAAESPRLTLVPEARQRLDLPGFGAIVADEATRSVFVSSGAAGGSIEEIGYGGTPLATLDREQGADGMVLSEDGRTLYVALESVDAVAAIDTATFEEKARYPMPAHTCPANLARTGPDVWIGYGCEGSGSGGVAVLPTDAASPEIAVSKQAAMVDVHFSAAPIVAGATGSGATGSGATGSGASGSVATGSGGEATGVLVVSQPYQSPTRVTTYATTAGPTPSLKLIRSALPAGSDLADLAVAPDGTTAFAAAGSQTTVDALATTDLTGAGQYTTGLGPDAVAVSPEGTRVAATAAIPDSDVYVWRVGSSEPVGVFTRARLGAPAPRGLAYSGDASLLFLVTNPPSGLGSPELTVIALDR